MSETFPFLTGDALSQRFLALDAFLLEHQRLWRPRPFSEPTMAWEAEHAELASWLRGRSLEQADAEHNQPTRLAAPAPYPQLAAQAAALG
ncbi:methyltransferase, partial [Pseudomonas aeruginosa]